MVLKNMEEIQERVIKNEARIQTLVDQRAVDLTEHREIFKGISDIRVDIASIPEKIKDSVSEKYALKWVEKAMIGLAIGSLGNIIGVIWLIVQFNR